MVGSCEDIRVKGSVRRGGFTLLEVLTVVVIIAIMVTASVVSIRQGQSGVRLKGTVRDVFAIIRHARSMALVTQKPCVITYATEREGDDVIAKIDIVTAKIFSGASVKEAVTLDGEKVRLEEDEPESASGETSEDILFAPVSSDVVRGVRLRVTKGDETLDVSSYEAGKRESKISVFSTSDYILDGYRRQQAKAAAEAEKKASEEAAEKKAAAAAEQDQEPVSVVWEANGRVEPHRVWIYPDGSTPDKGLSIQIDRFGGAKVLGAGEDE